MIRFEVIDATFNLRHKIAIKNWINEIILSKNRKTGSVNYLFADDSYVLDVNRRYLGHDYYTDIITFDTSDYDTDGPLHSPAGILSADIVISLDTVFSNSRTYGTTFSKELYRVMAHGVLHVLGYDDQTPLQSEEMRRGEEEALGLLQRFGLGEDQEYKIMCRPQARGGRNEKQI